MGDGAGTKQFQAVPDGRSLNEIASERVGAGGNGQSLPQFRSAAAYAARRPQRVPAAFPASGHDRGRRSATAQHVARGHLSPTAEHVAGRHVSPTDDDDGPAASRRTHGAYSGPPPPSQSFVSQPSPLNYAGQLPPHIAAALLQQMQQEAASANRRPPAFVDPTTSPFAAPTRMAHPTTATAAQPPSDDPFRSEHGRGNGVITFYVSADWSD